MMSSRPTGRPAEPLKPREERKRGGGEDALHYSGPPLAVAADDIMHPCRKDIKHKQTGGGMHV